MKKELSSSEVIVGCLGIIASPALGAWCVALRAWVAHVIWQWYPPFGLPAPTVAGLFAILVLVGLTRGIDAEKKGDRYGIWEQAFIGTFVPLFTLATVAIFRWCSS